jgi:hypothetical protein
MQDRDRGLFIHKRGSWQPVAASAKFSNRPVSGIFGRKNGRQTVMLDDRSAMTMINETLQPDESFAGRGKKSEIFRVESINILLQGWSRS